MPDQHTDQERNQRRAVAHGNGNAVVSQLQRQHHESLTCHIHKSRQSQQQKQREKRGKRKRPQRSPVRNKNPRDQRGCGVADPVKQENGNFMTSDDAHRHRNQSPRQTGEHGEQDSGSHHSSFVDIPGRMVHSETVFRMQPLPPCIKSQRRFSISETARRYGRTVIVGVQS